MQRPTKIEACDRCAGNGDLLNRAGHGFACPACQGRGFVVVEVEEVTHV